jgi:hypothetical protein|tara:strand:- start:25 stop:429 length:405 start_codon:yes stop_codon:yes gene_type:complete
MATLKTNTLTGTSTAGSIAVTGEGNSTTTNLQQGLAKVWSNLEQTSTYSTRDSFNLSSHGDGGTGVSILTFTTNFGNANHASASMASNVNNVAGNDTDSLIQTTSQLRVGLYDVGSNAAQDGSYVTVSIHGDLA